MGFLGRCRVVDAAGVVGALCAVLVAAACTSSAAPPAHPTVTTAPRSSPSSSLAPDPISTAPRPSRTHVRTTPKPSPSHTRPSTSMSTSASPAVAPPERHPVIVIDPGHSRSIHAIDPATGIDVSDYENEPEMRDVFAVAEIVKAKLDAAGYRVVMTKNRDGQPTSLGRRAHIANNVHAALALSIHDQAGSNGGIGFDQGNAVVYYQSVGDYRETPSGTKVYFTDKHVAALSKKYGQIFRDQRANIEHHSVALQGNTGYDLGSRGLPAGNIWIVQLLSHVPWIYNEAGGNSAGMSHLDSADKHTYADGIVASVEHCIRPPQ
jgi:N-acetylmuramoyl-L-alanine amidase